MTTHGVFNVPATGGWQSWQTVNTEISLPAGYYKLRLYIVSKEFNMNWFKVGSLIYGLEDIEQKGLYIYPNPASDKLIIKSEQLSEKIDVEIFNMKGQRIYADEKQQINYFEIDVANWPEGVYLVLIAAGANQLFEKIMVSGR